MDRMSDSGSDDGGSNPFGNTSNKNLAGLQYLRGFLFDTHSVRNQQLKDIQINLIIQKWNTTLVSNCLLVIYNQIRAHATIYNAHPFLYRYKPAFNL